MIKYLAIFSLLLLPTTLVAASHESHGSGDKKEHHDDHGHDDHKKEKGHDDHGHDDDEKHLSESDHVRVLHAWTRAGEAGVIQIFMEIENISDETLAVKSAKAGSEDFALAGLQMKDGEPVYTPLGEVPVKPGRELVLAPNGLVFQGNWPEELHEGDELDITVMIGDEILEVHVEVEAEDATQHSHAGHNH